MRSSFTVGGQRPLSTFVQVRRRIADSVTSTHASIRTANPIRWGSAVAVRLVVEMLVNPRRSLGLRSGAEFEPTHHEQRAS